MFKTGKIYNRKSDLHGLYGGNRQSGITPCAVHPIIFLFSSPIGRIHGYEDKYISDQVYQYCGEGQFGDMEFRRGNLAIKNHLLSRRHLYLFMKVRNGEYRYEGEFEYLNHSFERGPDTENKMRNIIIFRLKKIG